MVDLSFALRNGELAVRSLPLAEVLGAFSYALDITQGQPKGHCLRACWIGSRIGKAIGLSASDLCDLHFTVLLKDLGCSSNAARISALYLADDHRFKHDFKLVAPGMRSVLGFLFSQIGRDAPMRRRLGAIAHVLRNGEGIANEMIEARCTRGAEIARRLRLSETVAGGIFSLDELWDGSGRPEGLSGEAIPLFSRIALLAQVAEVFHAAAGPEAALAEVLRRRGTWFDPALVQAFERVAAAPGFWAGLSASAPALEETMLAPAALRSVPLDEAYLDDIAAAFGDVVDAKSPFTAGHSRRVADYTGAVGGKLGFDSRRRRWIQRGALLHDIGKLGVSNVILDKPGSLDAPEWAAMRRHATHTQEILGRISAFRDLAPIASAHHERLDGKGYPLGLEEGSIDMATRVITVCDIFDALTVDRPYRPAIPVERALAMIGETVGSAVDPDCYEALLEVV